MANEAESGFELVLDNKKLIVAFAVLIAFFGCFFVLGFIEGKRQGTQESAQTAAESQAKSHPETKPAQAVAPAQDETAKPKDSSDQTLDWYKNVNSRESEPAKIPPAAAPAQPSPSVPVPASKPASAEHTTAIPERAAATRATPVPPPSQPPKTKANAEPVTYCVQVGAFSQKKALDATALSLREKGFDCRIESPQTDGQLYRILVGKFHTRAEAAAMKLRLQKSGFSSFIKTN
jgi:cell division protein FtsN